MAKVAWRAYLVPPATVPMLTIASPNVQHQLIYDENNICRIAYQVREWRVIISMTYNTNGAPGTITAGWNFVMTGLRGFTTETDLQRGCERYSVVNRNRDTATNADVRAQTTVTIFGALADGQNDTIRRNTPPTPDPLQYRPRFILTSNISSIASPFFGVSMTTLLSVAPAVAGSCTFDGNSHIFGGGTAPNPGGGAGTYSGTATVSAETFWTYT